VDARESIDCGIFLGGESNHKYIFQLVAGSSVSGALRVAGRVGLQVANLGPMARFLIISLLCALVAVSVTALAGSKNVLIIQVRRLSPGV
jgi:hypothetical protein